jgi:cytochrome c oxidase subunit I
MHSPGETVPFLDPYPGRSGILSWIFSTDHKRIGMLYLWSILIMFAVGVVLGVLMRLELIAPGRTSWTPRPTTPCSPCTAWS